jgi:NAD(P)-dependent dehydrogenase (short-subunit alcohol dehydrogenase family)
MPRPSVGWMQSMQDEIEPFGINTDTVNPGFFRTELLTEESTNFAERAIDDYNERRAKQMEIWKATTVSSLATREARTGTDCHLNSGKPASSLHCRRRCSRHSRAGSCNVWASDRCQP